VEINITYKSNTMGAIVLLDL